MFLVDRRTDNLGFKTNFCTYILKNNSGLSILDATFINKREVGLKSANMKKGEN